MKERKRNVFGVRRVLSAFFAVSFVVALLGTISAFAGANLFKIQNAELSDLSTGVTGTISTFDETNIESNVTFHKLDDIAKYTITLKNTDSKDHVIQSITDDNDNPYVSYEYSSYANTLIKAGDSIDFIVTAKYANAVTDKNARAQATNVKFFLKFTDIDEPEELVIAPNTGDNIMASVTILAISATGLIVCALIAIKRNKKHAKVLVAAIVAVSAVVATASVHAAKVETNSISITSNYGLYDKVAITWTDANGDEHEEFVPYNEPANIPDQTKPGHTFTGWEGENGNPVDLTEPITDDLNIHPTFRAHKYTIKFNGNGATGSMNSIEMTYGETKALPASTFSFLGRTYAGWDTEANGSGTHYNDQAEVKNLTTEDNGIVTLYTQWSINPFFINYDGNGATSGEMATTNCEYDGECILRENAFKKTGYHFIGWKYNNTDYADKADVSNIIESGTITMVAQWAVNHYTIAFDGNGATSGSTASMAMAYNEEKNLTMSGFKKTGYTFAGWKLGDTEYTDGQTVKNLTAEDGATVTLKAQWTPTRYTIIFHANNDNVENPDAMAAQVVTYDVETALNPIEYTWWQHKLVEWTTNANGTGTKYADKATIKNLNANGGEVHLYAKWREIDAALNVRTHNTSVSALRENINPIISANPDVKNFLHYPGGKPSDEIIATATDLSATIDPIWAWADGENLYWWSEDYKPRFTNTGSVEYSFYALGPLDNVDLTGFDTTSITGSCRSPFEAAKIKNVDISDWDVSRCKDMGYFAYNSLLTSIKFPEVFDAQKVTNVAMAFNGAKIVNLDLSSWKTRDLKNASSFINMKTVEEVKFSSNFSTANITTMASMFAGSSKLTSLNLSMFDTANVQNMSGMFNGVSNMATLDISNFNTGAATNMSNMFSNMSKLETLTVGSNFTAASVISMASIFANDTSLTSLDLSSWGATNSLTSLNRAFSAMTNLATLDLTGWDLSSVNNLDHTFHQTRNIETIYASSDTDPSKFTEDNLTWTFEYATPKIVGGAGSTGSHGINGVHSRIDDPDNGKPGYFTPKDSIYIRYHDNDGDDTNDEANYALMPSYYVSTAEPYDVKLRTNAFEKEHYKFMGWATSADGEVVYADGAALEGVAASKNPLDLYAVWKERTAMFTIGTTVNSILKELNSNAAAFTHYTAGIPDFETIDGEQDIATNTSNFPIWAWTDGDTIYWWSEAEKPSLNPDSLQMFNASNYVTISLADINTSTVTNLTNFMSSNKNLRNIDFGDGDFTNVTTMRSAFSAIGNNYTTEKLTIDLSNIKTSNKLTDTSRLFAESYYIGKIIFSDKFETSGVTNFAEMFRGCGSLSEIVGVEDFDTTSAIYLNGMFWNNKITSLDLTGWNTSNVTTIEHLFRGCSKLETLNVSNWNVANVTNMSDVFGTPVLNGLDLSKWTNSKVTKTGYMFQGGNYTVLDLSGIDTSLVTDMGYMFNETGKIQTVYVSDKFVINTNQAMFINNKAMVGGAGTNYPGGAFMTSYGVVDDPDNSKPGFFTYKNARYIRYHDNDSDDTNDETNYALMPSHYMTTDSNNPYNLSTKLAKNNYERSGYRFLGWATSANGEVVYADEAEIANLEASKVPLELYAKWSLYYMQGATKSEMEQILPNVGDTITLYDKRDNEAYTVGKLADGNYWLLDNLRLDPAAVSLNTLKGNTNASDTSLEYLKGVRAGTTSDKYALSAVSNQWPANYDTYGIPYVKSDTKNEIPTGEGWYQGKTGVYYNYCAASAGSYCYGDDTHIISYGGHGAINNPESSWGNSTGNADEDICPTGWRLPYSGNATNGRVESSDYQELINSYESGTNFAEVLRIPNTLHIQDGVVFGNTWLWAGNKDNAASSNFMTHLNILNPNNALYAAQAGRQMGSPIRCMLK